MLPTGITDTVAVVAEPAFALQVYVLADTEPDEAVNVVELPEQIVALEAPINTTGKGFTFTLNVTLPSHPFPAEPNTV